MFDGTDGPPPPTTAAPESVAWPSQRQAKSSTQMYVRPMRRGEESLVLDILKDRPVENVMLMGLVTEHGLESPENRGTFYGCFSQEHLTGVALIGHHVLLSGSAESAESFAQAAQRSHASQIRVVLGEQPLASEFCRRLALLTDLVAYRNARYFLLALTHVEESEMQGDHLRLATPDEVCAIEEMNIDAFREMNGSNPATCDPVGFRQRISSRVAADRVWVVADEAGIAFKAEVVRETGGVVYLEAIITRPDIRGSGLGSQALHSLSRRLLSGRQAVCLLADADNPRTINFYRKVGFTPRTLYHVARYQSGT
jgi:predicted GNAT family acetyltransferase